MFSLYFFTSGQRNRSAMHSCDTPTPSTDAEGHRTIPHRTKKEEGVPIDGKEEPTNKQKVPHHISKKGNRTGPAHRLPRNANRELRSRQGSRSAPPNSFKFLHQPQFHISTIPAKKEKPKTPTLPRVVLTSDSRTGFLPKIWVFVCKYNWLMRCKICRRFYKYIFFWRGRI